MKCPRDVEQMWELLRRTLKDEGPSELYGLWFEGLDPVNYDAETNTLIFTETQEYRFNILKNKYKAILEQRFTEVTGGEINVEFQFIKLNDYEHKVFNILTRFTNPPPDPNLRDATVMAGQSHYTFDNFIVGASNRFACAACHAVAENPSNEYNPLFIHGPSGVGKTHLLYAMINDMKKRYDFLEIKYTKGEDFINYMIKCLSRNDMDLFRQQYRTCDVLLIDDIQFIAGKPGMQEELFHTFQTLFEDQKQIILASDRPPKDISTLEERLRSRFEQGLLADIQRPDIELRTAIIRKKAEDIKLDVPNEVITFLSENLRSNIRQIEGAMKKLAAKSLIDGRHITMELARDCVQDLLGDSEPLQVTVEKIFAAVLKKFNITQEEIVGKKRNKEIAEARHVAIYLVREITEMSLPNIGKTFNRDHATVLASIKLVENRIVKDPLFEADINTLKHDITGE